MQSVCYLERNKTAEFSLCGVSTVPERTKYICMYEQRNSNSVISVTPHMSQMLSCLRLKLTLHNKKTNDQIHANNYTCILRTTLNGK